jgi:hypothetical protein
MALEAMTTSQPLTTRQRALLTRLGVLEHRLSGEVVDGTCKILNLCAGRRYRRPFPEGVDAMLDDYPRTQAVARLYQVLGQ